MDEIRSLASELFDKKYVSFIDTDKFIIEEKSEKGKGKCIFNNTLHTLLINTPETTPKIWALKNQKCGESAFIHFNEQKQATLFLVEMKSTLTLKDFRKILRQFEGVYLCSLAILSLLKIHEFHEIKALVAFNDDTPFCENEYSHENYAEHHVIVGSAQPTYLEMWNDKAMIPLPHNQTAKLIKQQRVCVKNCGEANCEHEKNADFTGLI